MIRIFIGLVLVLLLVGCSKDQGKRYPMHGEVKALDSTSQTATIDAGKIGDWMEAMTMEYKVKPEAEFQKLHVGDRIDAAVVVMQSGTYYVTDVKVLPKP